MPKEISGTIREEDEDFAQPGTVSPGKVTQRHRDVDIVYRGGGDREGFFGCSEWLEAVIPVQVVVSVHWHR